MEYFTSISKLDNLGETMKKLIPVLMFVLMMGIAIAQGAPPVPSPVKILVSANGQKISYADTKVTNLFTGEVLSASNVGSLKIVDGVGLFDLSNFKQGYAAAQRGYAGDRIEVVACNIHPSCTTYFYIDSTLPRDVVIAISDASIVLPQPQVIEVPKEIIKEVPIEVIVPVYVCSDGTKVDDAKNCPIESKEHAEWTVKEIISVGGIAALGFAALYLYYRRKKQFARAEKMANTYISKRKK